MSIVKNSGLKQAVLATERGWETHDGKLVISSRNLLTSRVSQNYATPEEIKRWAESQLIEIEDRQNKLLSTIETNELRLNTIVDKFTQENKSFIHNEKLEADGLANIDVDSRFRAVDKIEYLQRKIEHLKVVAEYEKSFAASKEELERLNTKKEKIQAKLNTVLAVVPKLTESKSERTNFPKEVTEPKQENQNNKPVEAAKVEVLPEKKKKRSGPLPGWKARKAAAEAATKLAAEKEGKGTVIDRLPDYPVAPGEIVDD